MDDTTTSTGVTRRKISRRDFLAMMGLTAGTVALVACAQQPAAPAPAATSAPAPAPTTPPAAAPTTAPAAPTRAAAAAPTTAAAPTAGAAAPTKPPAPAATAPTAPSAKRFVGKVLHVHYWSGPEGDNIQKNVTDPFKEETGADVVVDYGYTSGAIAKLRAQKADPQLDVVFMDDIGVITTGPEDLLIKLDFNKIPNAADIDPQFVIMNGLGIGFFTYSDSLIYNTDHYKSPPGSWEELWNPDLKGQVGVPPSATSDALKLIIMAARLAGGDQKNVDPAWGKLAQLKPNVHSFIEDYPATAELFKSGEMKIGVIATYLFKDQQDKGYPIKVTFNPKEGFFSTPGCAAIPKGHPGDEELAYLYINKALSAEAQQGMARDLYFGPTNKKVKIDDPKIAENVVTPDKFSKIVPVDLLQLQQVRQDWITKYDQALKG
jgi:putative spermidine/putrescine transport system substrate-binding protein